MKIVIGYDSSAESDYILADLQRAGLPPDAKFLLISSTDMEPLQLDYVEEPALATSGESGRRHRWAGDVSPTERKYLALMVRGARQYAAERHRQVKTYALPAVQRLQAGFPHAQVTYQIVDDSPYFAITDHARMWNADLIVVGSHNSSAIGRFFLGSVSQSVANHANCSVRICRETPTQRAKAPRVLIGFDGSPASSTAVDAVAARAWPEKTQVRVVTVGEPKAFGYFASRFHHFAEPAPQEENGMEALPTWLRNIAERACKQLRLCGLDAEAWGFEGDPKKVLLDVLTEWNADCIFVGSSGQHERKNSKALGSVATVVANSARCSVELVRPQPGHSDASFN